MARRLDTRRRRASGPVSRRATTAPTIRARRGRQAGADEGAADALQVATRLVYGCEISMVTVSSGWIRDRHALLHGLDRHLRVGLQPLGPSAASNSADGIALAASDPSG